jgi:hypothetical protein
MECQYCKRILSSKSALNHHQKTAKYCLALRGKQQEIASYSCLNCDKTFTRKSCLDSHLVTCKIARQYHATEMEELIKKRDQEIIQLKEQLVKSEERNRILSEQVEYLRGYNERVTSQPKNVTKTTTNIQNINIFDKTPEDIDRIFQERFDRNYLVDGQKGVAQFTKIHVLEQGQGKPKVYLITDRSRCKAMYKNGDGELCIDYGMQGLTRKIHPSAKKKSMQIVQEHVGTEYYPILSERCTEILEMTDNNTKFCKEMVVNDIPNASIEV